MGKWEKKIKEIFMESVQEDFISEPGHEQTLTEPASPGVHEVRFRYEITEQELEDMVEQMRLTEMDELGDLDGLENVHTRVSYHLVNMEEEEEENRHLFEWKEEDIVELRELLIKDIYDLLIEHEYGHEYMGRVVVGYADEEFEHLTIRDYEKEYTMDTTEGIVIGVKYYL